MYLRGLAGPLFKNAAGQPISSIICGIPYTFDVPGYSQVWLTQTKNGIQSYDGPFSVPMPSYAADCLRDVGIYQNTVYEVVNGQRGALIGSASFQVSAQPLAQEIIMPPPTVTQIPAPDYRPTSFASSGAPILSTGVQTPSAPVLIPAPSVSVQMPAESEEIEPQEAGMNPWLMLAIGLGAFAFLRRR